ncbi:AP2 domain-containing protein [Xanthobacter autotrophicus DSM 597]|uniref:AP2 domain-containing protein n=1 Tax=Xanthobacter wiegelii TaxID=3119913 RepID=UPI00372B4D6F
MTTAPHYRGVSYDRLYRRWTAHIQVNGKRLFLGAFDTPEAAAETYDLAATEHHGSKAKLNKITQELAA